MQTTKGLARRYGVELRAEIDESLPALPLDEVRIRQAVVNLLVNGIRFSPRDEVVTVRTRMDGRFLRLEVNDRGPGLAPTTALHVR